MFNVDGEEYTDRYDIVAKCVNPNSALVYVGITFFRNSALLEEDAARNAISNAREKLLKCPPGCLYSCDLKNLSLASPETVLQLVNSNPAQIEASRLEN